VLVGQRHAMSITVGIDEQIFTFQNTGGISRYFTSLLSINDQANAVIVSPVFEQHRNHHLYTAGIASYSDQRKPQDYLPDYSHDAPELEGDADIIHSTYYHGYPHRFRKKIHLTSLYDMIPECFPELFPHGNPHANKAIWFEECDGIISISNTAADELIQITPHLAAKLKVIHLGFERSAAMDARADEACIKVGWPQYQYYLYVGSRRGYKNSSLLLKAYLASDAPRQGIHLVFAGGGPVVETEKKLILQSGKEAMVHFLRPTDLDIYILYKHARAVVVSSLAEGFSLPLVEALHFDAPLICSDIPVHAEVASQFAHFVSPLARASWSQLMSEPNHLKRPSSFLHNRYTQTVEYYTMSRMVSEHHQFYASLA
jgi:glycosyltransferase involved in cell wall biosynthesis